jgi:hypothetical protein
VASSNEVLRKFPNSLERNVMSKTKKVETGRVGSVGLRAAEEKAFAWANQNLTAYHQGFGETVELIHEDGTVMVFQNAFARLVDKHYIAVFSEHNGYHVQAVDDLHTYRCYKTMPLKKFNPKESGGKPPKRKK